MDRRYARQQRGSDHTFLFLVGRDAYLDASRRGGDARYINHSCDPNCEAVLENGRVFIEALRDIEAGEELNYDYALEPADRPRRTWSRAYRCRCGSAHCRKTMIDARLTRSRSAARPRRS